MKHLYIRSKRLPLTSIRLSFRTSGRWSLVADPVTMRVVAAMLRHSVVTPQSQSSPVGRRLVASVLRAFSRAALD